MKIIRWNAVGPLAGIAAIVSLLVAFFIDPVAKWAIRKGGESVFGARVDIDSVRVKVGKSALEIRGLAVADKSAPMSNLFELKEAAFDFQSLPLLEKKVIIDEASVAGLRFGTPRKTSGALPFVDEKPGFVGKASERLWSQVETFSLGKIDEAKKYTDPKTVVNPQALLSVKAAENAKTTLTQTPGAIEGDIKGLNAEQRAETLKAQVNAVGKDSKGIEGALKTAEQVKRISSEINALKTDIEKTKQSALGRIQAAKASIDDVKTARDQDWAKLKALVSLPSLDKESLARTIFGPEVVAKMERMLGLVQTARQYMPAKAAAPPPPPRGQGRVIEFPLAKKPLPRLLLKKALLSGEVGTEKPLSFEGTLTDLTSNPPLWGRPAVGLIQGAQGSRALNARLTLDYTQEIPREALQGRYSGFALGEKTVGQEGSFTLAMSEGLGVVETGISIVGDALSGKVQFQGQQLKVNPSIALKTDSPIGQRLSQSLTSSLSRVNSLSVGVGLGGTIQSPDFSIDSNIGGIVADAMKNALGAEVAEQEKALRAELNRHTDAALKQLEGQLSQLQSQFLPQISSQNKVVDDLLNQLKQKSLGAGTPADKPLQDLKNIFGR